MRIAVVTRVASPYQVEFLSAIGRIHSVSVVYMSHLGHRRPWAERLGRFEHVCLEDGPAACRRAKQWIDRADLVVFSWYRDAFVRRLMSARDGRGNPWVFWGEVPGFQMPWHLGRFYRRFALRTLHRSAAPIWGIGSWAVEVYRREFGPDRCYENVPYASDLGRFREAAGLVQRDPTATTFLYSGKLTRRKGVDLILRAAKTLLPVHSRLRLWLVGDGRLRPEAREVARQFPGRVRVWGFVPWEELPSVYAGADVLLAPSRHDGWNLAVAEGLAAGLAVISTEKTGAAIDLVVPGENGWRIAPGDQGALTSVIEDALTRPGLLDMRAAAARIADTHSLEKQVRDFDACARRAVADGPRGPASPTVRRSGVI